MQSQTQHQGTEAQAPQDAANDAPHRLTREELIELEAYRLAEQHGFPDNAALDHWLEAEKRISEQGSSSEHF